MKTELNQEFPGSKYKPVIEGGLVNHFGFYLAYLCVVFLLMFGVLACVIHADKIDALFTSLAKSIFL